MSKTVKNIDYGNGYSAVVYNTLCYNMVLDITWSCYGSQIFLNMEFYRKKYRKENSLLKNSVAQW